MYNTGSTIVKYHLDSNIVTIQAKRIKEAFMSILEETKPTDAFTCDYLTFILEYIEKPYDARIDQLSWIVAKGNYAVIAQFIAFANVTLAISEDRLLTYIELDAEKLREISHCCLDKRQWYAVKAKIR